MSSPPGDRALRLHFPDRFDIVCSHVFHARVVRFAAVQASRYESVDRLILSEILGHSVEFDAHCRRAQRSHRAEGAFLRLESLRAPALTRARSSVFVRRLANELRELSDRACLEQGRQTEVDAVRLLDLAEEPHDDQRLAAQLEEIVVETDVSYPSNSCHHSARTDSTSSLETSLCVAIG